MIRFWGEELAVAIVLDPHTKAEVPTENDVLQCAREAGMDDYKVPRQCVFVAIDQLPKSSTGKFPKLAHTIQSVPMLCQGKYRRYKMADALGVKPVDTTMADGLKGVQQAPAAAVAVPVTTERPSQALLGLRFLLILWVVQHHVALWPVKALAKLQSFTMNMPGFFLVSIMQLHFDNM